MKRTFIYALMVAAAALVSCTKTQLDPLKGLYPAANEPVLTSLVSTTVEKTESNRLFTFSFTGQDGSTLQTTLVGPRSQYYLEPGVYGPGDKNLCFVVSNGGTRINGKSVVDGQISVKQDGDNYRFVFVLFDDNVAAYRTKWEGQLVFEPDPEPVKLTELLLAQKNDGSVTVKLGTVGMSIDAMGTPVGDGCALTADLYSADGVLHEGVYTAGDGTVLNPGEFAPGYEFDASSWGMGIFHWGTCWWVGENVTDIKSGSIEVAKKGAKYVITWGSEYTYPNWAIFEGEIEALSPGEVPTPDYTYTETLGTPVDETFAPVAGMTTHSLVLSNKAGEEVAWFDLVLTEGVGDLSGDYLCKEYAHEDHTFGNGYDLSAWGMGMGGSRYIKNGAVVLINPGETLSVSRLGDDVYEISGDGFDFIFGNGGGSEGPVYIITDEMGGAVDETFAPVEGVTTHNLTLKTEDGVEVAYFQLVLTEGSTAFEGEYVCKEYAHEDHSFGNGYDLSMYGMGMGGTRYIGADGSVVLVNPGETLTVTVSGDVYKFTGSTGYEFQGVFE
ncbi:MAG: hypothetical protein IJP81_02885 [Bacteroidales bacterium]|nr:hypothetical protein [Bacteroidales bacterium]